MRKTYTGHARVSVLHVDARRRQPGLGRVQIDHVWDDLDFGDEIAGFHQLTGLDVELLDDAGDARLDATS
jgi:hypothetical protein